MRVEPRIVITGLLYVFTLASGVWVTSSGKPYNTAIFNIHKLIALAAVIATGVTVNYLRAGVDVRAPAIGAVVIAGLLALALFISGALLSIGKPDHIAILITHRVAPLLAVSSASAAIYLLASGG